MSADIWTKIQEALPMWVAYAIVTSIVGGTVAFIARTLVRRTGLASAPEVPPAPVVRPQPAWPEAELAHAFLAHNLAAGLIVSPGTRLVVVDRGVQQFALDPGTYDAARVGGLLRKHAVKAGVALQYRTSPVELVRELSGIAKGDGTAVTASTKVSVRVDDRVPQRILDWQLNRDGVVLVQDVSNLVSERVDSWLRDRGRSLPTGDQTMAGERLGVELERWLDGEVLAGRGLRVKCAPVTLTPFVRQSGNTGSAA